MLDEELLAVLEELQGLDLQVSQTSDISPPATEALDALVAVGFNTRSVASTSKSGARSVSMPAQSPRFQAS